jgi:hypothetical protein
MEHPVRSQLLLVGLARTLALVLLAALAGCGASASSDQAEGPSPLTEKQFANRLGDLCQEHTDRQVVAIERFDKEHGMPFGPAHEDASRSQLELELTVVILPIVRDTIHDLGRLRPPAGEAAEFGAYVRALEHGVAVSERDPGWAATEKFEPFRQAREASAALGTYYCGQA